jgi:hypothetical protein
MCFKERKDYMTYIDKRSYEQIVAQGLIDLFSLLTTVGGEDNYKERLVARDDKLDPDEIPFILDTVAVDDREWAYETAIQHPKFNDNEWIVIRGYDTKEEAKEGHEELITHYLMNRPAFIKDIWSGIEYLRDE